jgi:Family of unknown function (DUF5908)
MPIEIKELHIRIKIEEEKNVVPQKNSISRTELDNLKKQVVNECTAKILEKIKEREER